MWVDSVNPQSEVIERAARVVREGGVILYPSDTIYGLGCDPFCTSAVRQILDLKKRHSGKGLLVLIPGLACLERLARGLNPTILEICAHFWPGPLTLVLKANPELSRELTGRAGKIGVRWPDNPFLQAWMENIPGPLVSTSANLSGEGPVTEVGDLEKLFGNKVDLFLRTEGSQSKTASTVVDCTTTPPVLLRSGTLNREVESYIHRCFAGRKKIL